VVFGRLEQREYVSKEGEKRSVVEIAADEIAPSLRWARCEVERIEREKVTATARPATHDPVYGDEF
jgi:single-strand DNA-binding protein